MPAGPCRRPMTATDRLTGAPGPVPGAVLRRFADDLTERASAALATGSVDRHLHLGGAVVHLRTAGEDLAAVFDPALAHSRGDASGAAPGDLEVWAWDRRATGVAPPSPAWPLDRHLPSGAVLGATSGPIVVTFDRWQRVLTLADRPNRRVIVHAADASVIPSWVRRSPLRSVLTDWVAGRGGAMVHAGTVATPDGAVVLAGASGSGKSTTTLTCVAAGLGFMGDDAALVTFEPTPRVHTVYGRAKLEPDALERLETLRPLVVGADAGAPVLEPAGRLVPSAPLRAVALVEVGASDATSATHMAPAEAFRCLVESARDEGAGATLAGLRRMAAEVPCVRMVLGRDPDGVVAAVRRLAAGALP